MAEPKIRNPFDVELDEHKRKLMVIEIGYRGLVNSFQELSPRDRSRQINNIQMSLRALNRWIETIKISQIHNTGSKFAFENFKQTYFTMIARWRKFERSL